MSGFRTGFSVLVETHTPCGQSAADSLAQRTHAKSTTKNFSWNVSALRWYGKSFSGANNNPCKRRRKRRKSMAWTTPILVEICIGLEINGYLPAEF
ncbi:MAG: pyrroloquinoline quinone precursor peptide PqqA [Xanthobacteraceae bacterium]